jgi:hypothetical protein
MSRIRVLPISRLVIPLFSTQDLEVLKRCFFLGRQMTEMSLRISVFYDCRLDSMRGASSRHNCNISLSKFAGYLCVEEKGGGRC